MMTYGIETSGLKKGDRGNLILFENEVSTDSLQSDQDGQS